MKKMLGKLVCILRMWCFQNLLKIFVHLKFHLWMDRLWLKLFMLMELMFAISAKYRWSYSFPHFVFSVGLNSVKTVVFGINLIFSLLIGGVKNLFYCNSFSLFLLFQFTLVGWNNSYLFSRLLKVQDTCPICGTFAWVRLLQDLQSISSRWLATVSLLAFSPHGVFALMLFWLPNQWVTWSWWLLS